MSFRRHDLVRVEATAWAEAVAGLDLPREVVPCVAGWSGRGWPAMIRRRSAGDGAGQVPLAIQLPNALGRLRLALAAPPHAIGLRVPVTLAEVAAAAPPSWVRTIGALRSLGEAFGPPSVYGGLLWQHLTGEAVLRDGSDLDLLWCPEPGKRRALLQRLAAIEGSPRLDGEIVLEDGAGVSWRELHAASVSRTAQVAAKTLDGVELRNAGAILDGGTAPC